MPIYTEKRKADRAIMANLIEMAARSHGAKVRRIEEGQDVYGEKRISLDIETKEGLGCYLHFDGNSAQPDIYVIPWCIRKSESQAQLSQTFGIVAGGNVNPLHRQKCTAVRYGFNELLKSIDGALALAASGIAFMLIDN